MRTAIEYLIAIYTGQRATMDCKRVVVMEDVISLLECLYDAVAMVYDIDIGGYVPHDVQWIRKRVEIYYSRVATS